MLDVAMVKLFSNILDNKRSAIINNNLVRKIKLADVLSDEIGNSWACGLF